MKSLTRIFMGLFGRYGDAGFHHPNGHGPRRSPIRIETSISTSGAYSKPTAPSAATGVLT
jgi:hypothetical protein